VHLLPNFLILQREKTMKLIYRASTFNFEPSSIPTYHPHPINWRYQVNGEEYPRNLPKMTYHQPRAINWRWQAR
jgi:hypothetical protein